jgi:hypothetical protein
MKARSKRDFKENWQQTVTAIMALVATLLVSFGLITAEQSAQALPLVNAIVTGVGGIIAAVTAIIGIFFKPSQE